MTAAATTMRPATPSVAEGMTAAKAGDVIQVVEFLLGREHFAIDLFDVKEVVEYTRITELPNAPENIRGVIDLRGEITTIFDIRQQINLKHASERDEQNSRIIVVDNKITKSKIGIMVDEVLSVSTFSRSDLDVSAASSIDNMLINGVIRKKTKIKESQSNELVIWLDIRNILKAGGLGIDA
jgi:purine-binding chemotaxis protein CheW